MTEGCPVCGSQGFSLYAHSRDIEYCSSDRLYEYRECMACRSIYLQNPPTNELQKIYPSNYYSFQNQSHQSLIERMKSMMDRRLFRSILKRIPESSLRVLDVGGGSGWLLTTLRGLDPRIHESHIVDIDEAAEDIATSAGHIYHRCSIEEFRSEKQFHIILLLNLLEHVADPVGLLRKLHTLLAPGGALIIKTPNVVTLDARLFRKQYWGGLHSPRHFVLFTRASFLHAASESGFTCDRCFYTQGAPQWTCSVLGSLAMKGIVFVSPEKPLYTHPLYAPLLAFFAAFDFLRKPFAKTAQMFAILRPRG